MKTIVVGLGNTLLSDDGVGVYVARRVRELLEADGNLEGVSVVEAEIAGLDIIETLSGYDRALIVDAIVLSGYDPGMVLKLHPEDFRTTPRLASFHDIDLVTALELGKRLELSMPEEVVIYAVQADDILTLREGCTPMVESTIDPLAREIVSLVTGDGDFRVSVDPKFH